MHYGVDLRPWERPHTVRAFNALLVKKVQREGGEWCPMRICDRNENFAKIRTKEYRGENYISRICLESCQLRIKNLAN